MFVLTYKYVHVTVLACLSGRVCLLIRVYSLDTIHYILLYIEQLVIIEMGQSAIHGAHAYLINAQF